MNIDPAAILKAQIGELIWQNALITAEYNKLKQQLEEKNGPAPSESTPVE